MLSRPKHDLEHRVIQAKPSTCTDEKKALLTSDKGSASIGRRAASGAFVGAVGLLFNLGQSVIQVPILLHFWNAETYGVWGMLLASTGLVTSFDTGHQNYLGNKFCQEWIVSRETFREDLASGMRMALVLGALEVLVSAGVLIGGGVAWIGLESTRLGNSNAILALTFYLIYWAIFGATGGILVRMYLPAGVYARGQWLGVVNRFAAFLAVVSAAACGASVLGAMSAQIFVGTLFNLYLLRDLRRQFPELRGWWHAGNWRTAWRNFRSSLVLTVNGVVEQVGNNGLVVCVGNVLSPVYVALYTTLRTVANLAIQGTSIMLSPLASDFVRFHVKREGGKMTGVYRSSWLLGTSLVSFGLIAGLFLLEPLYMRWTRGLLPLDRLLFCFLAGAVGVRQWAAPFQAYLSSLNRLRSQSIIAVCRTVLALGMAFLLLPKMGLSGAGLGVLAGECSAAFVSVVVIRRELASLNTAFPMESALLALCQIGLTVGAWLLYAIDSVPKMILVIISFSATASLAWRQWAIMPELVRSRLRPVLIISRPA